jgi:hypothetical protein
MSKTPRDDEAAAGPTSQATVPPHNSYPKVRYVSDAVIEQEHQAMRAGVSKHLKAMRERRDATAPATGSRSPCDVAPKVRRV